MSRKTNTTRLVISDGNPSPWSASTWFEFHTVLCLPEDWFCFFFQKEGSNWLPFFCSESHNQEPQVKETGSFFAFTGKKELIQSIGSRTPGKEGMNELDAYRFRSVDQILVFNMPEKKTGLTVRINLQVAWMKLATASSTKSSEYIPSMHCWKKLGFFVKSRQIPYVIIWCLVRPIRRRSLLIFSGGCYTQYKQP